MAINGNYVFRETTANLTRNVTLTVASVLTVFVSLAIVGTTVLVRQGAQNLTRQFENGVEFIVYVEPDITPAQLSDVKASLNENPSIDTATYVGRDETYADFKKLFKGQDTMLENVRAADLPTSFRVRPKDSSVETVQGLVNYYRKQPNVFEVRAATDVIRQMKGMSDFVNKGLFAFAVFLLAASALLILNTIRTAMFARRREIEVMKLVGATNWFIRVPFMLEGFIQGLIGGVLAIGFVFLARGWIDDLLKKGDGLDLLQSFSINSSDVWLACMWVGITAIILSVGSSLLATRRFLDV
ncbi:cell division protein FtsX [Aquihabitans sp. McL0605]|uniref:cell division protein FtsX n=1 Tax=Aquihabitans sp. McL0605 TaxID=3415671 RepID=UPI003CE6995E